MTDEKKALDAIARALNPHWPAGHRGTYDPNELADLVEQQVARINDPPKVKHEPRDRLTPIATAITVFCALALAYHALRDSGIWP